MLPGRYNTRPKQEQLGEYGSPGTAPARATLGGRVILAGAGLRCRRVGVKEVVLEARIVTVLVRAIAVLVGAVAVHIRCGTRTGMGRRQKGWDHHRLRLSALGSS